MFEFDPFGIMVGLSAGAFIMFFYLAGQALSARRKKLRALCSENIGRLGKWEKDILKIPDIIFEAEQKLIVFSWENCQDAWLDLQKELNVLEQSFEGLTPRFNRILMLQADGRLGKARSVKRELDLFESELEKYLDFPGQVASRIEEVEKYQTLAKVLMQDIPERIKLLDKISKSLFVKQICAKAEAELKRTVEWHEADEEKDWKGFYLALNDLHCLLNEEVSVEERCEALLASSLDRSSKKTA